MSTIPTYYDSVELSEEEDPSFVVLPDRPSLESEVVEFKHKTNRFFKMKAIKRINQSTQTSEQYYVGSEEKVIRSEEESTNEEAGQSKNINLYRFLKYNFILFLIAIIIFLTVGLLQILFIENKPKINLTLFIFYVIFFT